MHMGMLSTFSCQSSIEHYLWGVYNFVVYPIKVIVMSMSNACHDNGTRPVLNRQYWLEKLKFMY